MNKIKKIFCKVFKIECCPKCESIKFGKGYWTRGWNNYCNQAYGDNGRRCYDCGFIKFNVPLEEHLKTLPNWCKPCKDHE